MNAADVLDDALAPPWWLYDPQGIEPIDLTTLRPGAIVPLQPGVLWVVTTRVTWARAASIVEHDA